MSNPTSWMEVYVQNYMDELMKKPKPKQMELPDMQRVNQQCLVPEGEKMTPEECRDAIGTYVSRFNEYGLFIKIKERCDAIEPRWQIKLYDLNRDFRLVVRDESLIGALRQADMAAGGWHAQQLIERQIQGDATDETSEFDFDSLREAAEAVAKIEF